MYETLKRRIRNYDWQRENIAMIVLILVGLWVGWNTFFVIVKNNRLQNEITRLQEEVNILKLENQNLELSIQYYATDEYIEQSLREDLLLKREGENVAISSQTRDAFHQPSLDSPSSTPQKNNFRQWLDFIRGE